MTRRPLTRRTDRRGFSIIELLVAIAVIALLAAILLPVLAQARRLAQGSQCLANLRMMGAGWLMAVNENADQIPRTRYPDQGLNWIELMDQVFPDAPDLRAAALDGYDAATFNACPVAQDLYWPLLHNTKGTWGYAVNTEWTPGELNELQQWSDVLNPSRYPWFTDADVTSFLDVNGTVYDTTHRVPRTPKPDKWRVWGFGVHHRGGKAGNASFADGSARSVDQEEILSEAYTANNNAWFENR